MAPTLELPGRLVLRNSEQELWLKRHVAGLCNLDHERFPGSQPVSFGTRDLSKLENQDFWVCEKSDGIRVLFLVFTVDKTQAVFLIDRHNSYRELDGLYLPHYENPLDPLRSTIVDGELVLDVDPRTKRSTLRFLAFDCLVVDGQNVMSRTLDKRYGRLMEWFYKPYAKMIRDHPHVASRQPFEIRVKEIRPSYRVEEIFTVDLPALQHGTDGLVYTCVNTPYVPGTDNNILKWKTPSENSIDFKLVLRFPPLSSGQPDFAAKPVFALHVWRGEKGYELYDLMFVEDDEWERLKESGEQIDDRIVEVHWDSAGSRWRMMRFRDDKPNGNYKDVVDNIIQSIADGVEKETLLARSTEIRNAWKARQGQPQPHPPIPAASSSTPAPVFASYPAHQPAGHPPADINPLSSPSSAQSLLRYGPLAASPWSKVGGPSVIAGMKR